MNTDAYPDMTNPINKFEKKRRLTNNETHPSNNQTHSSNKQTHSTNSQTHSVNNQIH